MEKITIEKALEFLCVVYFGRDYGDDRYKAASSRAYRDFNRTIRFKQKSDDEKRKRLREKTTELIRKFIQEVQKQKETGNLDQKAFDVKHRELSESIINIYKDEGEEFTHGQAQKWINMTLKYLYVLGETSIEGFFQYCHVPLDKYILDYSKKEFGINKPKESWSRWNVYETYLEYQKELRKAIKEKNPKECPLRWEFEAWMIASGK